jgi:hypothetical protein
MFACHPPPRGLLCSHAHARRERSATDALRDRKRGQTMRPRVRRSDSTPPGTHPSPFIDYFRRAATRGDVPGWTHASCDVVALHHGAFTVVAALLQLWWE